MEQALSRRRFRVVVAIAGALVIVMAGLSVRIMGALAVIGVAGAWAGPMPGGAASVLEPEPWESGPDAAAWTPALIDADSEQRQGLIPGPDPLPRVLSPAESAAPAPDPTRLPDGIPHPNPFLAEHGWATHDGWYVRQPELEHQLEAG